MAKATKAVQVFLVLDESEAQSLRNVLGNTTGGPMEVLGLNDVWRVLADLMPQTNSEGVMWAITGEDELL